MYGKASRNNSNFVSFIKTFSPPRRFSSIRQPRRFQIPSNPARQESIAEEVPHRRIPSTENSARNSLQSSFRGKPARRASFAHFPKIARKRRARRDF